MDHFHLFSFSFSIFGSFQLTFEHVGLAVALSPLLPELGVLDLKVLAAPRERGHRTTKPRRPSAAEITPLLAGPARF